MQDNTITPPVVTHWSRIFYRDLFDADDEPCLPPPDSDGHRSGPPQLQLINAHDIAIRRRWIVKKQDFHPETDSDRMQSPIAAAAILLGIYVAMYLAVGGIVRVLAPPEAVAHVPAGNWIELSPDTSTRTADIDRSRLAPQESTGAHAD
jgi:hypothetical protein